MSANIKSVVRRLGQGYLGHVVADSQPAKAPPRFDPVAEVTAALIGAGEADTVGPAAPDLAAEPARHPEPRTASILPEPSESRRGPRAQARAGIGNSAAMRERTTVYKIAKKDSGLKVETVPSPLTGPKFGKSTNRAAPTGGGKSPKPSGGKAGGHQSKRLQVGPEPEARSDGLGLSGRDGTQGPIDAGPRSESGVDPLSAGPIGDLQPAPRAPQRGTRSRQDARPAVTQTTSATPESRPKGPVGSRAVVVPRPRSEVRQSVAGQDRDRGPRVEIGSVDIQVVMDSPEPATEKVTSRPQPYIGSSRASRLYQRRL